MTANDLNCCDAPTNNLNLSTKATVSAFAVKATLATSTSQAVTQRSSLSAYTTTVSPDQISSAAPLPTGLSSTSVSNTSSTRKVAVAVGTLCGILLAVLCGVTVFFVLRRRKERLLAEQNGVHSQRTKDPSGLEIATSSDVHRASATGPRELESFSLPRDSNPAELEERAISVEIDDKVTMAELGDQMCIAELETSYPITRRDFQPPTRCISELSADTTLVSPMSMPNKGSWSGRRSYREAISILSLSTPTDNCIDGVPVSSLPTIQSRQRSFRRHDTLKFSVDTSMEHNSDRES